MKKSLLLILGLLLTTSLFAGPVGKEEAKAKALAFLNGTVSQRAGVAKAPRRLQDLSLASSGDAYHVFNIGASNGFVIVSGSDLTPDIIGYTDEGAFDAQNIPDNMKEWLQEYTNQIAWMEKQGEATASASKVRKAPAGVKAAIAPLIQTKWNQSNPYNYYCPNFVSSTKCVTGCMATALAQLLYYHHQKDGFPTGTKADVAAYECFTNWSGSYVQVDACPASNFDWDKMQLTYTGKEKAASDAKAQAVAKLMQYCGAAINMDYADELNGGSSASSDIVEPLKTYFGFDERVKLCKRTKYTTVEWENLIYQELVEKRPTIITGQSTGGGHAFICDGYDADGYFHINWGWGGTGNGYYLLNVANPHETGIGAGSSSDGYTMKQDALIGLEKPVGSVPAEVELGRLTVSGVSYTGSATLDKTTQTVSGAFRIFNKLKAQYDFQIGLGLFDENDELIQSQTTPIPQVTGLNVNSGWNSLNLSSTFDLSGLEDGKTYTVKPVSRFKGETEWLKCFGTEDYYLKLEAHAIDVSISAVTYTVNLAVSDVSPLDCVKGEVTTITATITNNGSNFNSNLYLFLSGSSDPVSGNGVSVEAGKKTVASFAFKYDGEAAVKTMKIAMNIDGTGEIWSGSLNVVAGVTGTDAPELTFSTKLNVDDDKILGNKLIGVVTATNNTDGNYTGDITLVRHLYEGVYDKSSWIWKNVTVPAHSSVDINFEYDVEMDKEYGAEVKYKHGGSEVSVYTTDKKYIAKPAVIVLDADGKETLKLAVADFTVPADVAVVDLRGQSVVTSVVPNSNPNCLYLLDESAAIPAGISNNVVKGATAANIVLKDGYDFYTPINFTATKISYTRTFTTGANKTGGGWNTIILPFDVTAVKKKGTDVIDWFKSASDTGKNFWLFAFDSDDKTSVDFTYTDAVKAYMPYLINMPNSSWGTENQLTNVPITFEGENALIKADAKGATSGSHFIFSGDVQKTDVSQCYVLNAAGTEFGKTTGTVPAFQAYFYPTTRDWLGAVLTIGFADNSEATGIQSVGAEQVTVDDDNWYTLQGVKLDGKPTEKGIYIYNGKKVAIK
ncbi:MAG: C10 family peptidase [Bacteroidaceae bacterium]|nr:C10 family peptidase [Bacteroidaceae bacterium]